MKLLQKRKGFTLIELLVVIAIIGILAALIIVSLNGARQKASDTQLKNNARNIDTALAQYYTDNSSAYVTSVAQIALNDATLTGGLAPYLTGGAGSAVFTFTGVGTGYITSAGGSTYLLATGLKSTSESATPSGNGIYQTNAGAVAGNVTANSLTLSNITGGTNNTSSLTNKAFVTFGPQ